MTEELMEKVARLKYERRWLIEQLAAAWGWSEEKVDQRLREDSSHART